jgi:excisionase family DNA binding protein
MHQSDSESSKPGPEPFLTIQEAASLLNLPVFKLRRAVKSGVVPSYTFANRRRLVRLPEIVAVIEQSNPGGGQ